MPYGRLDRSDSFITDCEKLRPFSQEEAAGLLAAMRMLDRQEPNIMSPVGLPTPISVPAYPIFASNIPGTALGITYREVGDRVQLLSCHRR